MRVPDTIEEAAHELALVKQSADSMWDTVKGYGQQALDGVNSLMPKPGDSAVGESMAKNPLLQKAWNFAGPEALAGLAGAGVGGVMGAVTGDKKKRRRNAVTGALAGAGLGAGGMLAARTMGFDPSSVGLGAAAEAGKPTQSLSSGLKQMLGFPDDKAQELEAAYLAAKSKVPTMPGGVLGSAYQAAADTPGVGGALEGAGVAAATDAALTGASWVERRRRPATPTMDAHAFQHGASVADETGLKNLGAGVSPEDTQAIYKQMANMDATTPGAAAALLAKAQQGQGHDFRLSPDVSHRFTPEQMATLRGDPAEALYHSLNHPGLRDTTTGIPSSLLPDDAVNALRDALSDKAQQPTVAASIHDALARNQPLQVGSAVVTPDVLRHMVMQGQHRTYQDRIKNLLPQFSAWTGGEDSAKSVLRHLSNLSEESGLVDFLQNDSPAIRAPGRTVHVPPARIRAIQDLGVQPGTWAGASPAADFMQNLTAPSSPLKPRSTWGSGLRRVGGYTAAGIGGMALEYMLRQRHAAELGRQYENYVNSMKNH